MSIDNIIKQIDAEIARLEKVRSLLAPTTGKTKKAGKRAVPVVKKKKRQMSKEGRARIAEAQKKRWAKQKKTPAKKAMKKAAAAEPKVPF